MARYVCRTLGIALDQVAQAVDGDHLVLAWPGANGFSRASVESRTLALGVDVVIEVQPWEVSWPSAKTERFANLRPDEPCGHPGCLHHVSHPCEGCGRIAGRWPEEVTTDNNR